MPRGITWIAGHAPDRQYRAESTPPAIHCLAEFMMLARLLTLPRLAVPRLALLAILLPALAACGPRTNEFPPACPNPAFLRDLSDLVR